MNYWLLTTEYPPLHGGGISTYCYFTAKMLNEAGIKVTVITQDDTVNDFNIKSESDGITIIRFNSKRDNTHSFLGYHAHLSYAFANMVKVGIEKYGQPDFIEAQDYLGIAYYITQFKHAGYNFLSQVPIIITLHSPAFIYLEYNRVSTYRYPDFWTGEMEKQSIVGADALISPTHFIKNEIEKYCSLKEKKVAIIANPYHLATDNNFDFNRNKIIYYGKLSPQKGSFELLAYFKQLWDNGFSHPLHIIGGTDIVYHPEQQTMGQLITKKYAAYIANGLLKFQGKIKPAQIKETIKNAHVIIVPSIVDNLPYVVMEAMSLGKIVLASKQGGQAEMIEDGVTGFLFDHEIPETFASQLNKILLLEEGEIKRIGFKAQQSIQQQFGFTKIYKEKISFLNPIESNAKEKNNFPFLYQEKIMPVGEKNFIKDLLSIVIPYFNMGKYIEECLQSVINSSYKNIEILIVNDGSNEISSIKKLETLKSKGSITIIDVSNKGLAAARNLGSAMAKGEFLAFLDADDKVAPSYYQKAIHCLAKNRNVFFVGAWVQYFENSNAVWPTFTPQLPYVAVHNPVNSSGLVYNKNAFLTGGLNDYKTDYGLEDYESVVNMLSHGYNGVVLPEILFYYRVRTGSMFRNVTTEKLLYSNKYIAEKHSAYYGKFATQIINLLNANGPGYLYDNPTFKVQVSAKSTVENILLVKLKSFIKRNERIKKIVLTLKQQINP